MAVGEFNQYRSPSFVVGGGQDETQKGPGTYLVCQNVHVYSSFEVDISSASCRRVNPQGGHTRVTMYTRIYCWYRHSIPCQWIYHKQKKNWKWLASKESAIQHFSIKNRKYYICCRVYKNIFLQLINSEIYQVSYFASELPKMFEITLKTIVTEIVLDAKKCTLLYLNRFQLFMWIMDGISKTILPVCKVAIFAKFTRSRHDVLLKRTTLSSLKSFSMKFPSSSHQLDCLNKGTKLLHIAGRARNRSGDLTEL